MTATTGGGRVSASGGGSWAPPDDNDNQETRNKDMQNDFLEIIKTRRSCRKYRTEQVSDAELSAVLEAGTYAPNGHGLQSPFIVAVQDSVLRSRLSAMNAGIMGVESDPYYGAPTLVLVFAPAGNANAVKDGSCVLDNMMLAAHALGLGSCWINREDEMFATSEGRAMMAQWGLPDGLMGVGALSLGYPAGEPRPAKPRKEGYVRVV